MASDGEEAPRSESSESLAQVLASIRSMVSAETAARLVESPDDQDVLMLTDDMRVQPAARIGDVLTEEIGGGPASRMQTSAPILDEEALRGVINSIVREELQGELGERISRNLQKVVRREINLMLEADNRKS